MFLSEYHIRSECYFNPQVKNRIFGGEYRKKAPSLRITSALPHIPPIGLGSPTSNGYFFYNLVRMIMIMKVKVPNPTSKSKFSSQPQSPTLKNRYPKTSSNANSSTSHSQSSPQHQRNQHRDKTFTQNLFKTYQTHISYLLLFPSEPSLVSHCHLFCLQSSEQGLAQKIKHHGLLKFNHVGSLKTFSF